MESVVDWRWACWRGVVGETVGWEWLRWRMEWEGWEDVVVWLWGGRYVGLARTVRRWRGKRGTGIRGRFDVHGENYKVDRVGPCRC